VCGEGLRGQSVGHGLADSEGVLKEQESETRASATAAIRNRLPSPAIYKNFAEAGGLITFGASLADLCRRATVYVDKILKGAKPDDLPVEQPSKFELVINLKTAKALGLMIPPSLLLRADQVIE
jgi:ABC-type uncharacterized transport system substrate-binding protein